MLAAILVSHLDGGLGGRLAGSGVGCKVTEFVSAASAASATAAPAASAAAPASASAVACTFAHTCEFAHAHASAGAAVSAPASASTDNNSCSGSAPAAGPALCEVPCSPSALAPTAILWVHILSSNLCVPLLSFAPPIIPPLVPPLVPPLLTPLLPPLLHPRLALLLPLLALLPPTLGLFLHTLPLTAAHLAPTILCVPPPNHFRLPTPLVLVPLVVSPLALLAGGSLITSTRTEIRAQLVNLPSGWVLIQTRGGRRRSRRRRSRGRGRRRRRGGGGG